MKKVKNTELNEKDCLLNSLKSDKVKKSKPENAKKLKNAVGKTAMDFKGQTQHSGDASAKTIKKVKIMSVLKEKETFKGEQKKVVNSNGINPEKQKQNISGDKQSKLQNEASSKEVTEADLKKIERKKEKKLAQKLKKKQKKALNKDFKKAADETGSSQEKKKVLKKLKKSKSGANEGVNEMAKTDTNNKGKPKLELSGQENDVVKSKVLTANSQDKKKKVLKKFKKSKSGENDGLNETIKTAINNEGNPKLELQENEAAISKVLTKKAKNAAKRQLIKTQKLAEKQTRIPGGDEATVFVGNLPVNTKRVQLVRLFKDFGPVNYIRMRSAGGGILHKHKQRKLAGSLNAYVVLNSKEKAEKALSLNGVEFKGYHLRVTLESKKTQGQENEEVKRTVFVGNLKYTASEEPLREIFSSCGEIEYVRCIRNGDAGCKGVAYVCFKTADAVGLALELNQTIFDDRPINVERYSVRKLGAKQAREAEAERVNKPKTGANQRIKNAKGKKDKSKPKFENRGEVTDAKKPKKSEFRGVKVEGLKKKQKSNKKKKSNDQMQLLAKKIAPKPKN